jgi:hypothetical protein
MTGSAPTLLLLALFCTVIATFFNLSGPVADGAAWWRGRLGVHFGWLGISFMLAYMIWK